MSVLVSSLLLSTAITIGSSCIYLLLDEEKLLASPNDGAEEARLVAIEEVSSDQTPVEPDPYAKFIPEYINEPFVVALFATFSAIILQG